MAEGIFRAATTAADGLVPRCQGWQEAAMAIDQPGRKFTVISRGLQAFDGDSASDHSINALKSLWNIDISFHKAKRLKNDEAQQADLILTMTRQHRDFLHIKYPEKKSCIYTLKEFAYPQLDANSPEADIVDPYGMPYEYYEGCAREIYECMEKVLYRLK